MPPIDETDDIILPDNVWGEIYYIKCVLSDIYRLPVHRKRKWKELKRQIRFFCRWMKNK